MFVLKGERHVFIFNCLELIFLGSQIQKQAYVPEIDGLYLGALHIWKYIWNYMLLCLILYPF